MAKEAPNGRDEIFKALQTAFRRNDEVSLVDEYLKHDPINGFIHTGSYLLDQALSFPKGEGMPVPCIVEISGAPGSGKSSLAATLLGNTQKTEVNGQAGLAVYIDNEAWFTADQARRAGLSIANDNFIYLQAGRLEDTFKAIDIILDNHERLHPARGLAIALDSIAMTSTNQEREADGEAARALHARVINRVMREGLPRKLMARNIMLVLVNQTRATMNTAPGAAKEESFGGSGLKYDCRMRIHLSQIETHKNTDTKVAYGIRVCAKIIKNKITDPYRQVEYDLRFRSGIEDYYPVMEHLAKRNKIAKAGSYLVWNGNKYFTKDLRKLFIDKPAEWVLAKQLCFESLKEIWTDPAAPVPVPETKPLAAPPTPVRAASTSFGTGWD